MRQRNLFISHSWTYGDAYEKLCGLLDTAPRFSYRNYSVPKDDPVHDAQNMTALYKAIKDRVAFCEVVLIMAGKYASYSQWIQREIKITKADFDKPLVAIRPWANLQVSSIVRDNADQLVAWNTNSIVSAIREVAP